MVDTGKAIDCGDEIRLAGAEVVLAVVEDGPVAEKGESQEICFVPDGDYARFIEKYLID